jgi:hypothetical protein
MDRRQTRRRATLTLAGCMTVLSPVLSPGLAEALAVFEASRSIAIGTAVIDPFGNPLPYTLSDSDPVGFGPWASALADGSAHASQTSLIDEGELSGGGGVGSHWNWEYGNTRYHVVFAVEAGTDYAFHVDNVDSGSPTGFDSTGEPGGSVRLRRVDPGNFAVVLESLYSVALGRDTFSGSGLPDVSAQGTLAPGTYALDFVLRKGPSHLSADNGAAGFSLVFRGDVVALAPEVALHAPGGSHTVSARVEDASGAPKPGAAVQFDVASGPNAGASGVCTFDPGCSTDADGYVYFTYDSNGAVGVDEITATSNGVGSNTVLGFWDADCNENEIADACDLSCDGFDGHCAAFAGCGSSADTNGDLVPDECNAPPDCSVADAEPSEVWPPNHSFTPVVVQGVTDEDGDAVVITITSIRQDEPVASPGGGSFSPDALRVGTDTAQLRAEREGGGDGRVYHVGFSAADGRGASCTGAVVVCVPPNMRSEHACEDQGLLYDSTVSAGGTRPKFRCGLGFELVMLAPLLARLARQRRA